MVSQIKVNEIIKQSGSTITIGESGDTITLTGSTVTMPSGATLTNFPDNTPMFRVFRSTDQSISNGAYTKIQYNSENYDADSVFDSSSNYRFTAPSAGKYYFLAQLQYTSTSDGGQLRGQFYVNGSAFHSSLRMQHTSPNTSDNFMVMADVISLSANDYVEVYGYQGESGSRNFESYKNYFLGYKLIGT